MHKCVFLRAAAHASEKSNTHIRLYLRPLNARSRMKMKRVRLASNPTPSAILFTLAYYDGAKRVKKRFADLEEAKQEAELAATKLANGEGQMLL